VLRKEKKSQNTKIVEVRWSSLTLMNRNIIEVSTSVKEPPISQLSPRKSVSGREVKVDKNGCTPRINVPTEVRRVENWASCNDSDE